MAQHAALLLLLIIPYIVCISLPLGRRSHVFSNQPTFNNAEEHTSFPTNNNISIQHIHSLSLQRNTIPMGGGFLNLGAYYAEITVGTPPVKYNLLVDTGSSNTAIPGEGCNSCGKGVHLFNPSTSSTYSPLPCSSAPCTTCSPLASCKNDCSSFFGKAICANNNDCGFEISYGGGSSGLIGYYGYDKVCFGGTCTTSPIGIIQSEVPASSFNLGNEKDPVASGIMGLASDYNACNPSCIETIVDTFSPFMPQKVFGMCLTATNGGVLDWGAINNTRYDGSLSYANVIMDRWYNVKMQAIYIGKHRIEVPEYFYGTSNDVIGTFVDSGTSLILCGPVVYAALKSTFQEHYSQLPGVRSAFWNADNPCISRIEMGNHLASFPNVTISLQGDKSEILLPIPPSSYLVHFDNEYCMGIAGVPSLGMILGDIFMQNYYIVFDRQSSPPRVGFAPVIANNCDV